MKRTESPILMWLVLMVAFAQGATASANSMALFNLKPTSIEAMSYNGEIMYALRNQLEQTGELNLMPRRVMQETLERLGLTQSTNQATIRQAGIKLGVEFVLFGSVAYQNERAIADLKLLKVRLNKIVGTWRFFFYGEDSIQNQMPTIVEALTQVTLTERPTSASDLTSVGAEAAPDPIQKLSLSNRQASVGLSWSVVASDPVGFNIYRSQTVDGPFQLLGKTTKTAFDDTRIQKGQTYYYRIGVILSLGEETKSPQTVQVMNAGEKQPNPPLVMSSSGHVRRAVLKMVPSLQNQKDGFEITHYIIWRATALQAPQWVQVAEVAAKPSLPFGIETVFEDTQQLSDGARYFFAVSSQDTQKRRSPLSSPMEIQTVEVPELRLVKDDLLRRIELSWTSVFGATGYHLYRSGNDEQWARVATIKGNQGSQHADQKKLTDQKTYQYRVTAFDEKGETGPSNVISAKTKDLPPIPSGLIAQNGEVKSVTLTWTPVNDPDVGGYTIFRGEEPTKLEKIASVEGSPSNQYLDKSNLFVALEDGKRYFYAIDCYNLFKAAGERTEIVEATTKPRPATPTALTATTDNEQMQVQWQPNAEADIVQYELSKQTVGGFLWSPLAVLDPQSTQYTDEAVKPGKQYKYRLIAIDKDNLKSDPAFVETAETDDAQTN